jgi:hypothetical protein
VPDFVPRLLQSWRIRDLFPAPNGGPLRVRSDMTVVLQHLTADVSSKRADGLFADVGILGQPGDERVPQIVPAVAYPGGFAGTEPSLAPRAHWTVWVDTIDFCRARIPADSYMMKWKNKTLRGRLRKA